MLYKDLKYPAGLSDSEMVDWEIAQLTERLSERGYKRSNTKSMSNLSDFNFYKGFRPDQTDPDNNADYQILLNFYDFRNTKSAGHLGLRMTPEIMICSENLQNRTMTVNDSGFISIEEIEDLAERFYQFCKE